MRTVAASSAVICLGVHHHPRTGRTGGLTPQEPDPRVALPPHPPAPVPAAATETMAHMWRIGDDPVVHHSDLWLKTTPELQCRTPGSVPRLQTDGRSSEATDSCVDGDVFRDYRPYRPQPRGAAGGGWRAAAGGWRAAAVRGGR